MKQAKQAITNWPKPKVVLKQPESGISELEKVVFLVQIDFFFLFEIEKAAVTTYVFLFRKF